MSILDGKTVPPSARPLGIIGRQDQAVPIGPLESLIVPASTFVFSPSKTAKEWCEHCEWMDGALQIGQRLPTKAAAVAYASRILAKKGDQRGDRDCGLIIQGSFQGRTISPRDGVPLFSKGAEASKQSVWRSAAARMT